MWCKVTGWLQTFLGENLCGTYHGCIRDLWMATQMQSVQLVSWVMGLILDTHTMEHHGPRQIIAPISIFAHICSIYNLYIYIYVDIWYMYIYIYNTFHFMCRMGMKIPVLFPSWITLSEHDHQNPATSSFDGGRGNSLSLWRQKPRSTLSGMSWPQGRKLRFSAHMDIIISLVTWCTCTLLAQDA